MVNCIARQCHDHISQQKAITPWDTAGLEHLLHHNPPNFQMTGILFAFRKFMYEIMFRMVRKEKITIIFSYMDL